MAIKTGEIMRGMAYYIATKDNKHFFDDERETLGELAPEVQKDMERVINRMKRFHSLETEEDFERYEKMIIQRSTSALIKSGNELIVLERLHKLEQENIRLNKENEHLREVEPLIIMEAHIGEGLYTIRSTDEIDMYTEQCETCGDCDTYLGEFSSADEFLADEDGKGYDEEYVREFFTEEFARRDKENDY